MTSINIAKHSENNLSGAKNFQIKVSRRRKDFVVKTARALIQSADLVAIEDLKVQNMVKNHHLAKSISHASWALFRQWLEYLGKVFDVPVIAVAPHYTSQNCSYCGCEVKKSLSTRTHQCNKCGYLGDRDTNAAINILRKGLQGLAQLPRGTRKVTSGDEMTLCDYGETQKSKVARRTRKSR